MIAVTALGGCVTQAEIDEAALAAWLASSASPAGRIKLMGEVRALIHVNDGAPAGMIDARFPGGLAMATGMVFVFEVIRAYQRRLVAFATALVFAIAALPALAQQQESTQNVPTRPPYPYGYGHMMWGGGWGWHPGLVIACTIFTVLAIIGLMAIFVWLVRWAVHGFPFYRQGFHHLLHGRSTALDILEERFARGEVDKAEFEDKRKTIGR